MTPNAAILREQLIRNFNVIALESFERGAVVASVGASLTRGTAAKKLGCSIDIVQAGKRACPYHLHHAQEEMFIVLEGEGTLRVAGEMVPIRAGDVITIPAGPEFPHHILNTSNAPLKYLSISTKESPELCEYPDSGKSYAFSGDARLLGRSKDNLDYWDGEP